MDALPYTENVARVHRIPQRGMVAQVALRSKEHLECDIFRSGRVVYQSLWAVGVLRRGIDISPSLLRGFCRETCTNFAVFVN